MPCAEIPLRAFEPAHSFRSLFQPAIRGVWQVARSVLRFAGIRGRDTGKSPRAEIESRLMMAAGNDHHDETLRTTHAELLDHLRDFSQRLARQVMIHRTDMQVLDADDSLEEIVRLVQDGGHTRYPLIEGDIDTIIGFVHTKDLFALFQHDQQGDIRGIVRRVMLVPETIRVDMLLRQMQRARQHFAVLVDEYGGTAGMVTIFDLLEELVGDLPDEFEPAEEDDVVRLSEHTFSVDGRLPLSDLEDTLTRKLPCEESCDTVGGYTYWAFGRIPDVGDSITRNGIMLRVLDMDNRRVSRVEVTVIPEGGGVKVRGKGT